MTRIALPTSWVREGTDLAEYLHGKGYTYAGGGEDGPATMIDVVETLDTAQMAALRADLLTDFNPITIETV